MPNEWTEAYVYVNMNGTSSYAFYILNELLPKSTDNPSINYIFEGFDNSTGNNLTYLRCNKQTIQIYYSAYNNTNLTSVASATLYYR